MSFSVCVPKYLLLTPTVKDNKLKIYCLYYLKIMTIFPDFFYISVLLYFFRSLCSGLTPYSDITPCDAQRIYMVLLIEYRLLNGRQSPYPLYYLSSPFFWCFNYSLFFLQYAYKRLCLENIFIHVFLIYYSKSLPKELEWK